MPRHKILLHLSRSQAIELVNLKCNIRSRIRRAAGVAHGVGIDCYVVISGPNASPAASSAACSPAIGKRQQEAEQTCARNALSQSSPGFRWNKGQSKNEKRSCQRDGQRKT